LTTEGDKSKKSNIATVLPKTLEAIWHPLHRCELLPQRLKQESLAPKKEAKMNQKKKDSAIGLYRRGG